MHDGGYATKNAVTSEHLSPTLHGLMKTTLKLGLHLSDYTAQHPRRLPSSVCKSLTLVINQNVFVCSVRHKAVPSCDGSQRHLESAITFSRPIARPANGAVQQCFVKV
jgi:hypothetical protein